MIFRAAASHSLQLSRARFPDPEIAAFSGHLRLTRENNRGQHDLEQI